MNQNTTKAQIEMAVNIARTVGKKGRSVLIFVSGIFEIGEITTPFEAISLRAPDRYCVVAIHSDIPFEDQMQAFNSNTEQVKMIPFLRYPSVFTH